MKCRKSILFIALLTTTLFFHTSVAVKQKESATERVQRIYKKLVINTGLRQIIPPILVVNYPVVNAYNNRIAIVVYTGLINNTINDDELALIIGHEMAHTTLSHFSLMDGDVNYQSLLESQADKMGAYYIMRSGYNVCVARMFWKRMIQEEGDYLGADHPSLAYRFDQLNIGCEK